MERLYSPLNISSVKAENSDPILEEANDDFVEMPNRKFIFSLLRELPSSALGIL